MAEIWVVGEGLIDYIFMKFGVTLIFDLNRSRLKGHFF